MREALLARYREQHKRKRTKWITAGLCSRCGQRAPGPSHRNCKPCRERTLYLYHTLHRNKRIASHKEAQRRLKLETFAAYGGAHCRCCGENEIEFMSIDHINGSGMRNAERKEGRHSGNNLYRRLKREGWPPGFRVLCMNCNFAIGHFGSCPHEKYRMKAI